MYHGNPLQLEEHISRLKKGAKKLYIEADNTQEEIFRAANDLIEANGTMDGTIRVTITRGGKKRGLSFEPNEEPNLVITTGNYIPYPENLYRYGMQGIVVEMRRNNFSPLVSLKTLNFLEGVLALEEARKKGGQEGIFMNLEGNLCEGTISNIFWINSGTVYTPHISCGLVPGIVRGTVIKLCREQGLHVEEVREGISVLWEADEAFLTNSLMEVMPLVKVNNRKIGSGIPGKTTRFIRGVYRKFINENT